MNTCCVDHFYRLFQLSDGSIINCQIYDTAGQEQFFSIVKTYYKKADAILLVYDISNKDSFEKIKNDYVKEIKDNCKKDIPIILLGNKADKENERQIPKEEGMELARQENYEFDECCCIKNINVASAFETLLERWNFERHKEKQKEKEFKLRKNTITEKKCKRHLAQCNIEIEDDISYNTEINRNNTMEINNKEKKGRIILKGDEPKKKRKKCCK